MAIVLLPDLERADTVFPRLIMEYAPAGLAGLMLAGLMAAIMSSVDSALNSASTLLMVDFVQPRRPDLSTRQVARRGRITTLTLMLLAALWAPAIDRFPGLFAYLQQTFAYVTPPLVAAFTVAFCSRAVGASAALWGVAGGHLVSLCSFVAAQAGWLSMHFTIVAGLLYALTLALILLLQLVGPWPQAGPAQGIFSERSKIPVLDRRIRLQMLSLAALTFALVVLFS